MHIFSETWQLPRKSHLKFRAQGKYPRLCLKRFVCLTALRYKVKKKHENHRWMEGDKVTQ